MKLKYKCGCMSDSPFMWMHDKRPSVFMSEAVFRANKDGRSASQVSTAIVDKTRQKGEIAGFLRGISRKREEEMLRIRNFMVYSLPKPSKPKEQE